MRRQLDTGKKRKKRSEWKTFLESRIEKSFARFRRSRIYWLWQLPFDTDVRLLLLLLVSSMELTGSQRLAWEHPPICFWFFFLDKFVGMRWYERSDKIALFREFRNTIRRHANEKEMEIPKWGRLEMSKFINQFIVVIIFGFCFGRIGDREWLTHRYIVE